MIYEPGDKLCSYTLLQKCGNGAFGEVWLVEDVIGTRVALKILSGSFSEREIAGLKNYKECNHPNLLKIRHVEISGGILCCTMDAADDLNHGKGPYIPDTLANRLNKSGRLDDKDIADMLDDLLNGLAELHKYGLVHRDIKPDNILWVNGRATLSDVGLVAPIGKHTLAGSPGFVSPRLLDTGAAEFSDDFFALSRVVYCALTGLSPAEYPAIPPELTISIDPRINRAALAGCSQQIKSAAEFRRIIAAKNSPAAPVSRKYRLVAIAAATAAAAVVLGIFLFRYQSDSSAEPLPETFAKELPVFPDTWDEIHRQQEKVKAQLADAEKKTDDIVAQPSFRDEFFADRQRRCEAVFKKYALFSGEKLSGLLAHEFIQPLSMVKAVYREMNNCKDREKYKLIKTLYRTLENTVIFDTGKLEERRRFWQSRPGTPEQLISIMLADDQEMQLLAVNMIFCRLYKDAENSGFDKSFLREMLELAKLQNEFINPEFGLVDFLHRKGNNKK